MQKGQTEQIQAQKRRISELKAQEKELSAQYEELEKGIYLCDQFTKAKVRMNDFLIGFFLTACVDLLESFALFKMERFPHPLDFLRRQFAVTSRTDCLPLVPIPEKAFSLTELDAALKELESRRDQLTERKASVLAGDTATSDARKRTAEAEALLSLPAQPRYSFPLVSRCSGQ